MCVYIHSFKCMHVCTYNMKENFENLIDLTTVELVDQCLKALREHFFIGSLFHRALFFFFIASHL